MAPWPVFVAAGAVIGLLVGLFGVGGSQPLSALWFPICETRRLGLVPQVGP
jgi:uncharacterized membrane protein YfcA